MAVVVVLVVGAVVIAASLIAWKVRSEKSSTGKQQNIQRMIIISFHWIYEVAVCSTYI